MLLSSFSVNKVDITNNSEIYHRNLNILIQTSIFIGLLIFKIFSSFEGREIIILDEAGNNKFKE